MSFAPSIPASYAIESPPGPHCGSLLSFPSAVSGWVQFTRLFSGDPNEDDSEDRITDGFFEAVFVDPNDAIPELDAGGNPTGTYTYPMDRQSTVFGEFNFVFHRGTPAQPFP